MINEYKREVKELEGFKVFLIKKRFLMKIMLQRFKQKIDLMLKLELIQNNTYYLIDIWINRVFYFY